MSDTFLKEQVRRAEQAKANRGNWESTLQIIREYVRPTAEDFNRKGYDGEILSNNILDDTAIRGAEDLGSLLVSSLTPDTQRWFQLTIADKRVLKLSHKAKLWLELVSDIIYQVYSLPSSGHATSNHEALFDIVSFGTGVKYQDIDEETLRPVFRTFPLADCVIFEDHRGLVDTLMRYVNYTTRMAKQKFDGKKDSSLPSKVLECKDPDKSWKFMHLVYPRTDRDPTRYDGRNMKFASCWVCLDDLEHGKVMEKGYRSFPYHVGRWAKRCGEVYGRSPAWNCLPSILMLNKMCETTLVGAMKIVDPVLLVPDDGFLATPKTFPGAINIYEAGSQDRIEPLETKGRPELGLEMEDRRRQLIARAFYTDLVELDKKSVEMTAYEAAVRNEDRLKMMGPMTGRLMHEFLGLQLARTYEEMDFFGWFPPAPEELRPHKLLVEFVGPAAKAQQSTKSLAIDRLLQSAAVIANFRPEVMDKVDPDKMMDVKADTLGVPESVLRSDEEVLQIRKTRQQKEQMAEMVNAAPAVSGSIKDVATAQAALQKAGQPT